MSVTIMHGHLELNPMHINKLVEEVLSEAAVELLNSLAAHALVSASQDKSALHHLPIEADSWNSTIFLAREIFEAEVLLSGEADWLSFRILQSLGVKDGKLVYQFTPTFAQALG